MTQQTIWPHKVRQGHPLELALSSASPNPENDGKDHHNQDKQKSILRLKFTRDLLGRKKTVKMIVGLLRNYCRLKGHMHKIGIAEDAICRFWNEEKEIPVHVCAVLRICISLEASKIWNNLTIGVSTIVQILLELYWILLGRLKSAKS